MDESSRDALVRLVREQRVAALGTLFHGGPLVSLVPFSVAPDLSSFEIHVSRLAQHTQGLLGSGRVGLMIAEPDRPSRNPQTLPRLSIQGEATALDPDTPEYAEARSRYLEKFPNAGMNFQLADFLLVRIEPRSARLVSGFGRIFDLSPDDLAATGP
jgi:putative heme iron utilization protein